MARRRRRRNHGGFGRFIPSYQPKFDVLAEVERQLGHSVRSEKAKKYLNEKLPEHLKVAVSFIRNNPKFEAIVKEEREADKQAIKDRFGPILDVLKDIVH